MKNFITASEAVALIKDNDTVAVDGFCTSNVPEEILVALEEKYKQEHSPKNLTFVGGAGVGEKKDGLRGWNHFGHEGLVGCIKVGHLGLAPNTAQLVADEKCECYLYPQGSIIHVIRAKAGNKPGILTHIGLGTYADPRIEGCRINKRSMEKVVELMEIDGKEWLYYKTFPINVAIIRGTTADTHGNLTMEKHPIFSEQLIYAQAAKNSGGLVLAQVERVTEFGSLRAQDVKVPGVFVDYVVLADPKNQPQNFAGPDYDPALAGEIRKPLGNVAPMPMDERKICARRAAMELKPGMVGNIGIGVGEGVSNIVAEENLGDLMTLTLESGAIGGVPTGGHKMGCTLNPEAIIDQAYQFDFYDGGGLDICYLGLAEADRHGNLNVSKFAGRVVGPGGFINIAQNAKTAVFCGTFTAKGLKVRTGDGKLAILEEGAVQKFVPEVGQITFSGAYALKSGQKVLYVTERCVFRLTPQGMTLVEVAPGINVEQDIIGRMGFRPAVSPALKLMDERIFLDRPMGLKVNGN